MLDVKCLPVSEDLPKRGRRPCSSGRSRWCIPGILKDKPFIITPLMLNLTPLTPLASNPSAVIKQYADDTVMRLGAGDWAAATARSSVTDFLQKAANTLASLSLSPPVPQPVCFYSPRRTVRPGDRRGGNTLGSRVTGGNKGVLSSRRVNNSIYNCHTWRGTVKAGASTHLSGTAVLVGQKRQGIQASYGHESGLWNVTSLHCRCERLQHITVVVSTKTEGTGLKYTAFW